MKNLLAMALLVSVCVQAHAQDSTADANNPLASATALNFQDLYIGDIEGSGRDANQFYLRFARPLNLFGSTWITRLTAPWNTVPKPGGGTENGLGDLNLFAAYLIDVGKPGITFGVGPQVTAPTASDESLGSDKWSVGFANVLFNASSPKYQWGYLLTWQTSVAGDGDRPDVNAGAFQPFAYVQLGGGWHLRSSGLWTYNFETDDYAVPLGLGVGKVTMTERAVVNVFVEPQWYVWTSGDGQPEWSVFAGLNFQF